MKHVLRISNVIVLSLLFLLCIESISDYKKNVNINDTLDFGFLIFLIITLITSIPAILVNIIAYHVLLRKKESPILSRLNRFKFLLISYFLYGLSFIGVSVCIFYVISFYFPIEELPNGLNRYIVALLFSVYGLIILLDYRKLHRSLLSEINETDLLDDSDELST